jgi:DNA polymerase III epsilon subunit-like protein
MIFLDTETTGLNAGLKLDTPVSIAIVGTTEWATHIQPMVPMDAAAEQTHGLTPEVLASAPTFGDIEPDLTALLTEHRQVAAWNAPFDLRILMNAYHHLGKPMPRCEWFCAMERYGALFGVFDAERGTPKAWKLTVAFEVQFGALPILTQAHGARADAVMASLLWALCDGQDAPMHTADKPAQMTFVTIERKEARNGNAYAELKTVGGLRLNIFPTQFDAVRAVNPTALIPDWLAVLATREAGYVHPLKTPLELSVNLSGKYPELHGGGR